MKDKRLIVDETVANRLRARYEYLKPVLDGIIEVASPEQQAQFRKDEQSFWLAVNNLDPQADVTGYVKFAWATIGPEAFDHRDVRDLFKLVGTPRASRKGQPNALQMGVLRRMAASGNLIYVSGGFWTTRGVALRDGVPEWYVATGTRQAMERAGWIEPVGAVTGRDAFRDERRLTALGAELAI